MQPSQLLAYLTVIAGLAVPIMGSCHSTPCQSSDDCDASGCDYGCGFGGRCIPNPIGPPCGRRGCTFNSLGQLVSLTDEDIAAGVEPLPDLDAALGAAAGGDVE